MKKLKALLVLLIFVFITIAPPQGWSQTLSGLKSNRTFITALGLMPRPGHSVSLSASFDLAHLKGMVIDPADPFKFDFIVHQGNEPLSDHQKQEEYTKLIKYFLAALAVPDRDQWVNLSPYEKNRIIPSDFGRTEMGRDLLAQDYLLKQLSSSLTNPETSLGKKFWDRIYERVYQQFGTRNVPLNTFNKVWIVPDKVVIYEKGNMVYVISSHLKVMTEEDYLATKKHRQYQTSDGKGKAISNQIMRQIIVPAIEQEANEGSNFAPLRQVLSGMLLATWYKRALKESILAKLYADKDKLKGVNQDPSNNEKIYQEYLKAYKKGVYNMIKEEADPLTQEVIPRKYFSGGLSNAFGDPGMIVSGTESQAMRSFQRESSSLNMVRTILKNFSGILPKNARKMAWAGILGLGIVHATRVNAQTVDVELAWTPSYSPNVVSNTLFWGTNPGGPYTSSISVNAQATNVTLVGLLQGQTYYMVVNAVGANGLQSENSGEVSFTSMEVNSSQTYSIATGPGEEISNVTTDNPNDVTHLTTNSNGTISFVADNNTTANQFATITYTDTVTNTIVNNGITNVFTRIDTNTVGVNIAAAINVSVIPTGTFVTETNSLGEVRTNALGVPNQYAQLLLTYANTFPQPYTVEVVGQGALNGPTYLVGTYTIPAYDLTNSSASSGSFTFTDPKPSQGSAFYTGTISPAMAAKKKSQGHLSLSVLRRQQRRPEVARRSSDAAMGFTKGGIDFATSNLDMQIKHDGKGMPLPVSQQNLDNLHIDGLVPVVLDIKPVEGKLLFGKDMEENL